jgi:hypothetical protein
MAVTFFFIQRNERDTIKKVYWCSFNVTFRFFNINATLTLRLLMSYIYGVPFNAIKLQMGFNSVA